jgi:hypothetical protein
MIAISYRREDSLPIAGRLYDRLQAEFGKGNVFMDFDSIPYGVDFRQHIKKVIERSKVLVAMIGPDWVGKQRHRGRRIDDPTDFVRLEITYALERKLPIIPILVRNMQMPRPEELPKDIEGLVFRNALSLDVGVDFHHHAERLITSINALLNATAPPLPAVPLQEAPATTPTATTAAGLPDARPVSSQAAAAPPGSRKPPQLEPANKTAPEETTGPAAPGKGRPATAPNGGRSPAIVQKTSPDGAKRITTLVLVGTAIVIGLGAFIYFFGVQQRRRSATATPVPTASPGSSEIATPAPLFSSTTPTPYVYVPSPPPPAMAPSPAEMATPVPSFTAPAPTPYVYVPSPTASPLISQNEAETFISSFYHILEGNNPNDLLSYYDDTVDFFGYGRQNKSFIANDYQKYFGASPVRSYSIGDIQLYNSATQNTATASFDIHYRVENPAAYKHKTGRAHEQWVLVKSNGFLKIIDIKETIYPDSSVAIPQSTVTMVPGLSQDQAVRDFILRYYAALSQHNLEMIMSGFAEGVYYDGRVRSKQYVRNDVANYLHKYSALNFNVRQPITVSHVGSNQFGVSFTLRYNVANRYGNRHGLSLNQWVLQFDTAGNLQITSQRETVYRGR